MGFSSGICPSFARQFGTTRLQAHCSRAEPWYDSILGYPGRELYPGCTGGALCAAAQQQVQLNSAREHQRRGGGQALAACVAGGRATLCLRLRVPRAN